MFVTFFLFSRYFFVVSSDFFYNFGNTLFFDRKDSHWIFFFLFGLTF